MLRQSANGTDCAINAIDITDNTTSFVNCEPVPAFIADPSVVISYAQYVAEGFVLLITTVHGFRYIQGYVYIKTSIHCCWSRSASRHRNHVITAVIFCCALSS